MDAIASMSFLDFVGFVGVGLYLFAYAALQTGFMRGDGYAYGVANGLGAACVLASLFQTFILSSVILQVIWIGLSVFGLARLYYLNSRLKFSPDEQAFLDAAMPDLSKIDARKFLNVALVIDGEPGTQLTHEGEPISHLIYLLNGEAVVFSGGVEVARIQEGHYIGDVTYMLGEPATASVDVAKPSRYLAFEVTALRAFLERNAAVKRRLEQSAADNLRKKLTATTKTAASQRTAQAAE